MDGLNRKTYNQWTHYSLLMIADVFSYIQPEKRTPGTGVAPGIRGQTHQGEELYKMGIAGAWNLASSSMFHKKLTNKHTTLICMDFINHKFPCLFQPVS